MVTAGIQPSPTMDAKKSLTGPSLALQESLQAGRRLVCQYLRQITLSKDFEIPVNLTYPYVKSLVSVARFTFVFAFSDLKREGG